MARDPRSTQFPDDEVTLVHCVNRCVRRAMLCGSDPLSGRCCEHRRQWIQDRLEFLAGSMLIDVCGFAVMSNHVHVVLRNRPDLVKEFSDDEVRRRWWELCPARRADDGHPAEPTDIDLLFLVPDDKLDEIRIRLSSVSWFMRFLCERIARRSNTEDDVTGRFWEGRFKAQPLLDEAAVLACTMYVDLNPIRAAIAKTPESSQYTSAYERIQAIIGRKSKKKQRDEPRDGWLTPISLTETHTITRRERRASDKGFLPLSLPEYLRLLDWTGRQIRHDKRGSIPTDLAPILDRLQIAEGMWIETVKHFGRWFKRAAGRATSLRDEATRRGTAWLHGTTAGGRAFG